MNPQSMMKIMGALNTFRSNHPKFFAFLTNLKTNGVPEGTVIEISVTRPGEEPITTNMKVQASDLELVKALGADQD